jgi:hypothetical protein
MLETVNEENLQNLRNLHLTSLQLVIANGHSTNSIMI